MAEINRIILDYDARIKNLEKDFDKIKKGNKEIERDAKKSASNISSSFKAVGSAIAAAFSVRVISSFLEQSVKAFDVQAKAEASLLTALKGREDIQKRLIKQASELQKQTLFGDEETIRAASRLAQIIGVNEEAISSILPLVQDFAAATGMDLNSSAELVGKSIGSSTNALTRYGIEITGAVGSTERLESAIEGLNNQVGGQAETAARTGTGAITQLQNAFGDLQEEIGELVVNGLEGGLIPALNNATTAATNFFSNINTLQSNFDLNFFEALTGAIFAPGRIREFNQALEDSARNIERAIKRQVAAFEEQNISLERAQELQRDLLAWNTEYIDLSREQKIEYDALQILIDRYTSAIEENTSATEENAEATEKAKQNIFSYRIALADLGRQLVSFTDAEVDTVSATTDLDVGLAGLTQGLINYRNSLESVNTLGKQSISTASALAAAFQAQSQIFAGFNDLLGEAAENSQQFLLFQLAVTKGAILASQAEAIAAATPKALGASFDPISFGVLLASFFGTILSTIGQATSILSQAESQAASLPSFERGGLLDGKSHKQGGVLVEAEGGEFITNRKHTKQHLEVLEAINSGKYAQYVADNYVLPTLKNTFAENIKDSLGGGLDGYRLERAIRSKRKTALDDESAKKVAKYMAKELRLRRYH